MPGAEAGEMAMYPSRGYFLSRVDFSSQTGLPLSPSPLFYLRLQSATFHFLSTKSVSG